MHMLPDILAYEPCLLCDTAIFIAVATSQHLPAAHSMNLTLRLRKEELLLTSVPLTLPFADVIFWSSFFF